MRLTDLLMLYGAVGVACGLAIVRAKGAHALWSALVAVPLWPVWAPFVLSTPRPRGAPSSQAGDAEAAGRSAGGERGARTRIERALDEAVKAVAGTPMADVFSREVAARIAAEVARVHERMEELRVLKATRGLDHEASLARLRDLEARGAPPRTLDAARLQHESLARLEQLRAADAQALEELADLLEALRAQLLLARYAGSSADGTGAIVSEVWARLEGLGAAFVPERDA